MVSFLSNRVVSLWDQQGQGVRIRKGEGDVGPKVGGLATCHLCRLGAPPRPLLGATRMPAFGAQARSSFGRVMGGQRLGMQVACDLVAE